MKERPIIFGALMVRAILSGRKTVTRRVVKLPVSRGEWAPSSVGGEGCVSGGGEQVPETPCIRNTATGKVMACPYGESGDRLWVKETFQPFWADSEICPENRWKDGPEGYRINYVADSGPEPYEHDEDAD